MKSTIKHAQKITVLRLKNVLTIEDIARMRESHIIFISLSNIFHSSHYDYYFLFLPVGNLPLSDVGNQNVLWNSLPSLAPNAGIEVWKWLDKTIANKIILFNFNEMSHKSPSRSAFKAGRWRVQGLSTFAPVAVIVRSLPMLFLPCYIALIRIKFLHKVPPRRLFPWCRESAIKQQQLFINFYHYYKFFKLFPSFLDSLAPLFLKLCRK